VPQAVIIQWNDRHTHVQESNVWINPCSTARARRCGVRPRSAIARKGKSKKSDERSKSGLRSVDCGRVAALTCIWRRHT